MAEAGKARKGLSTLKVTMGKSKADFKEAVEGLVRSKIHIAVAGEPGTEKLAFINVIRGLEEDEEEGPSSKEEPTKYCHPKFPRVKIWDLPCLPASNFSPDAYLEKIRLGRYEAVLVTTSEEFASEYVMLSSAIVAAKTPVYFVLLASLEDSPQSLQEKKRKNKERLKLAGLEAPRVFLVSRQNLGRLEFLSLLDAMEKDLPEMKMNLLLISLPVFAASMLQKKKKAFKNYILKDASYSAGVNSIPLPEVGAKLDHRHLEKVLTRIRDSFDLDNASLQRLARRMDQPVEELKSVLASEISMDINKNLVIGLLAKAKGQESLASKMLEASPVRYLKKSSQSMATTYFMLHSAMDELEEDAKRVLEKASHGKENRAR
ncbi:interferon-inducible GTPase 5-like [Amia ocellicauda]|uniref:interferon-inducible GTPase 5-like n=1 Tax=Amia ocellicauda TaxID=2972642 RepID=UPI003463D399